MGGADPLGAEETAVLQVELAVPSNAIIGTVNHTVITATSGYGAAISIVVTNTVTVTPWMIYVPLILRQYP
jgi:hypothetical protein